jgi:hypothetical protein
MSVIAANRSDRLDGVETHLVNLARAYAADQDSWPFAPRFNPTARWYGRIGGDHQHEAWLLTWLPGQHTQLHNHGGSAGAFTVVSGGLTEQVAVNIEPAGVSLREVGLATGALRGFGPHHVHRLVNNGLVPAVSVHVYSPALSVLTNYRIEAGRLAVLDTTRSGVDW